MLRAFVLISAVIARDDDDRDEHRKARETPKALLTSPSITKVRTPARATTTAMAQPIEATRPLLVNDTFTAMQPVPFETGTGTGQQSRMHLNKIAMIVGVILATTFIIISAGVYLGRKLRKEVEDDSTLFSATKETAHREDEPVPQIDRVRPIRLSDMNIDQLQHIFPSTRSRSVVPSEFMFAEADDKTVVAEDSVSQVVPHF